MTNELDRIKPVRFPTLWLTYKGRINRDLDRAYGAEGGAEYFNPEYFSALSSQVKQLEDRVAKLLVLQITLTAFQVVGFVGNDASISLFGITLKQAAGVKEIVISLYALVAVATWITLISRDTGLTVLERLIELSTEGPFVHFGKLAAPTPFNLKLYISRTYEDWIFPTRSNSISFGLFVVSAISVAVAVYAFSIAINVLFFLDIYRHPTLGVWSNWILGFVSLTLFFGVLFLIRFYFPQPYSDQSPVLELQRMEAGDPVLYHRRLGEIYGVDSEYRKYKWSYRAASLIKRCRDSLTSTLAAANETLKTMMWRPVWNRAAKQTKPRKRGKQLSKRSPRTVLFSFIGGVLGLCATVLALWEGLVKTNPLVTPQAMESPSSVLHFKVENPSFVFDMHDVTLACQVLKIETGPVSPDAPVQFITPIANDNGRVLSERKHFSIIYRNPIDFNCGAESVFRMEKGGVPYYPPHIEIGIIVQFKTLWFQRALSSAGPFVAIWSGDKYRWTEGATVTVEPIHRLQH